MLWNEKIAVGSSKTRNQDSPFFMVRQERERGQLERKEWRWGDSTMWLFYLWHIREEREEVGERWEEKSSFKMPFSI